MIGALNCHESKTEKAPTSGLGGWGEIGAVLSWGKSGRIIKKFSVSDNSYFGEGAAVRPPLSLRGIQPQCSNCEQFGNDPLVLIAGRSVAYFRHS
jgi:hypothetical protein